MILSRLMRVLTLLAVLMAPLAMLASPSYASSAASMPIEHAAAGSSMAGHCPPADDEAGGREHDGSIDCRVMCSAITVEQNLVPAQLPFIQLDLVQFTAASGHGCDGGADPPPPRLS